RCGVDGEVEIGLGMNRITDGAEARALFHEVHSDVERQQQLSGKAGQRMVPHKTVRINKLLKLALFCLGRFRGASRSTPAPSANIRVTTTMLEKAFRNISISFVFAIAFQK